MIQFSPLSLIGSKLKLQKKKFYQLDDPHILEPEHWSSFDILQMWKIIHICNCYLIYN